MRRTFAPRHVDALIPKLEKTLRHAELCLHRASTLRAQSASAPDGSPPALAQAALARAQAQFLEQAVQDDVDYIGTLGGVVRDLQAGLVDFPGSIDGQDVWLCWKRGEPHVHFWHAIHAGFAQRQAIRRSGDRSTSH